MAKRFTDSNKYDKPFFRSLPGAYKLLWDFLYHDCDSCGIWIVDFEVAQIKVGRDMPIDQHKALELFNADEARIIPIDQGKRWFLPGFIEFQYRELSSTNPAHRPVISALKKYDLLASDGSITRTTEAPYIKSKKPLGSPLEGAKEKEKDKVMEKVLEKEGGVGGTDFSDIDLWTQSALDRNDPVLEAMELKDERATGKPWPEGFDRAHWILHHRGLVSRYGWTFDSQQDFRQSLLSELRKNKFSKPDKPLSNGKDIRTPASAVIKSTVGFGSL